MTLVFKRGLKTSLSCIFYVYLRNRRCFLFHSCFKMLVFSYYQNFDALRRVIQNSVFMGLTKTLTHSQHLYVYNNDYWPRFVFFGYLYAEIWLNFDILSISRDDHLNQWEYITRQIVFAWATVLIHLSWIFCFVAMAKNISFQWLSFLNLRKTWSIHACIVYFSETK